jgi:hypothetical protein
VVATSVVVGALAAAIVSPGAGVPIGLATFLALAVSYGRGVLALASVGLLVAVDWIVTASQGSARWVAEFGWPTHFGVSNMFAWFAVVALGADALVQELRERRVGARTGGPDPDEGGSDRGGEGSRRRRRRRGKHVRSV